MSDFHIAKASSTNKLITKAYIVDFFDRKKQENIVVVKWKPYVLKKLGQVYINNLFIAGLIDDVIKRNIISLNYMGLISDCI